MEMSHILQKDVLLNPHTNTSGKFVGSDKQSCLIVTLGADSGLMEQ